jgi:hypothetical protein
LVTFEPDSAGDAPNERAGVRSGDGQRIFRETALAGGL